MINRPPLRRRLHPAGLLALGLALGLVGCAPGGAAVSAGAPARTPDVGTTTAAEVTPETAAPQASSSANPEPSPAESPAPTPDWSEPPPEPDLEGLDGVESARRMAAYALTLYPYVYNTGDLERWKQLSHPECIFCRSVLENVETKYPDGTGGDLQPVEVRVTSAIQVSERHHSVDAVLYEPPALSDDEPEGAYYAIGMVLYLVDGAWQVRAVESTVLQRLEGLARDMPVQEPPAVPGDPTAEDGSDGVSVAAHYATALVHGGATGDLDLARGLEHSSCEGCAEARKKIRSFQWMDAVNPDSTMRVTRTTAGGATTGWRNTYVWVSEQPPDVLGATPPAIGWSINATTEYVDGRWQVTYAHVRRAGPAVEVPTRTTAAPV